MRILMIAGGYGAAETGVAGVVYSLADELRSLGHQVTSRFMPDILPKPTWPSRFQTVEFSFAIASYVKGVASEFDLVNIHAPYGFVYGAKRRLFGSAAGPPYVMTMHGLEERRNYAMGREAKKGRADYFRWKNRVWQYVYHMPTYRFSIKSADQSIVFNREAKVYLEDCYHVPGEKVWFISNGVGQEFFQTRSLHRESTKRFLFVGTWLDHKGIYYLVEAFEKLLSLMPDAQLTVAGCIIPEEAVRGFFSNDAQMSLTVKRFVKREDMPGLYAQHDIFVLPSLVEGMPLVLLEAMASGMPVVTTESCGMTDVVEDSYDGLFVIPGDPNSLLQAMLKLCNDCELRQQLGAAATKRMERHTWNHSARRHEQVFYRAIGQISPDGSLHRG